MVASSDTMMVLSSLRRSSLLAAALVVTPSMTMMKSLTEMRPVASSKRIGLSKRVVPLTADDDFLNSHKVAIEVFAWSMIFGSFFKVETGG